MPQSVSTGSNRIRLCGQTSGWSRGSRDRVASRCDGVPAHVPLGQLIASVSRLAGPIDELVHVRIDSIPNWGIEVFEACARVAPMDSTLPTRPQSHDHHTVPKFWLKQFADSQGFLKELDAPKNVQDDLTIRRTHVKRATVEKDLYVLDSWFATHDIDERQIFGPLEDKAAKVLSTLWNAEDLSTVWPLPEQERNDLARFLAASVIRTPKFRQDAQIDLDRQVARNDRPLDPIDLFRSGVIVGEPDDMARLGRRNGLWREGDKAPSNVQSNYMRAEIPKLSRHLFNQRWVLMRTPEPAFVLSDNPVALMTTEPPTLHTLTSLDSRMSFAALSRTLILITEWHPAETLSKMPMYGDGVIPFDKQRAGSAAWTLISNAHAHFYEHPDDSVVEDVWARRGGVKSNTGS